MKQDRNGVRTAQDLERKYDFNSISTLKRNYELQKTGLTKVENEINNFVSSVTKNLKELQDQVDGNITTWFSSGVPTTENYPTSDWKTIEDKNNHLGDLYYDKETGYAYRYSLENEEYLWVKISDVDITKALAIANSAQDTADSKRRVFVIRPSPPYDVGDLWIKDEELYRCQTTRPEGETFEDNDWIKATKYTDDTYAVQVGKDLTVLSGTVTEIKNGVDEISQTITHTNELVDAQGNVIGTLSKETSELRQSLLEILLRVSGIFEISDTVSGIGQVEVPSSSETKGFELKISNACEIFGYNKLFGSDNLFGKDTWLKITYEDETYNRYKLPILALRKLGDVYDELNIKTGRVTITKRIGITAEGELYLLEEENTTSYNDIPLLLKEGKNIIELESFPEAEFSVNYMVNNPFTEEFATKMELSSSIDVLKDTIRLAVEGKISEAEAKSLIEMELSTIKLEVSQKITKEEADNLVKESEEKTKETTDALSKELEGKIDDTKANELIEEKTQGFIDEEKANELIDDKTNNFIDETKANDLINKKTNPLSTSINDIDTKYQEAVEAINEEMGTKIGEDDFNGAQIILKINDDNGGLLIRSDKVYLLANDILNLLAGNAINLTSKDITIESEDLSIDKNGNIELRDNSDGTFENTAASLSVKNIGGVLDAKYTSLGALLKNSSGFETSLTAQSMFMLYNDNSIIIGSENPLIGISDGTNGVLITPTEITTPRLTVNGSKNRVVEIDNKENVLLNAYETATPYFGDIGTDKTDENGYCKIDIEDIFSQTIELDTYKVFLQELGEGNLYVKKYDNYFEVLGTPDLEFDYEIKAIQKGYKNVRLEKWTSNIQKLQSLNSINKRYQKKEENRL